MLFICFILCLVGGALIETPLIGFLHHENGIVAMIGGIVFGSPFLVLGIMLGFPLLKEMIKNRWQLPIKDVLEALKPGFKEASDDSPIARKLTAFRKHYSDFLQSSATRENDPVQGDVTQIFRNVLQFQKNRLNRLGLTCELMLRRMSYTSKSGIQTSSYSDGKYNITDVREQVAAKTVLKRNDKVIHTRINKEIANYTILNAQQVGADKIICPNCGTASTRTALLDGCDYCGTRFTVEDLGSKIAVFAFRPSVALRYEKYRRIRDRVLFILGSTLVLGVFLGFTIYGITIAPTLFADGGGVILVLLAEIFATLIASPIYILSFLIVDAKYFFAAAVILIPLSIWIAKRVHSIKEKPTLARGIEQQIRKEDPNFSIANFYSGLQNKLSSVIFAETKEQMQAFAEQDLPGLFGKYDNVAAVDVDHLDLTTYYTAHGLIHAEVDAHLLLTRLKGTRCSVHHERLKVELVKSASCKTQAVCAPALLRCRGCGTSLDLLQGKKCIYCGRELSLINYDWVIRSITR